MDKEYIDKIRTRVKDLIDQIYKGVQFLLVAHGAGIAACVAALKDYATTPALKGIGAFIWLFSCGFFCGIIAFIFLGLYQLDALEKMFEPQETKTNKLTVATLAAAASCVLLSAALGLLCSRLGSL